MLPIFLYGRGVVVEPVTVMACPTKPGWARAVDARGDVFDFECPFEMIYEEWLHDYVAAQGEIYKTKG